MEDKIISTNSFQQHPIHGYSERGTLKWHCLVGDGPLKDANSCLCLVTVSQNCVHMRYLTREIAVYKKKKWGGRQSPLMPVIECK